MKLFALLPMLAAGGVVERWLEDLQVSLPAGTVPPFEADVKILLGTVHVRATLEALVCDGFRLSSVESAAETQVIDVSALGASATCRGQVDYDTSLGLKGTASAVLETSKASAEMKMLLGSWSRKDLEAPELEVKACRASLALGLTITGGSFWTQFAKILPGVEEKLQSLANQKISEYLCGPAVEEGKAKLHQWMQRSLLDARAIVNRSEAPLRETWVDWSQHPLTQGIHELQEQFLEPFKVYDWLLGERCMVGSNTTCFTTPICLYANETESCAGANGTFAASLKQMLWNISDFALTPLMTQNASVAARLSAGRWQLRPTLNLSYKPEGPFEAETEIVPLRLSFSNVLLAGNLTAGVDRQKFGKVPSFQYFEGRCVAGCTEYIGLNRLLGSLELQDFAPANATPTLLTSLLNLTSGLLGSGGLSNYTDILLQGAVEHQLAERLNQSLAQWLATSSASKCPLPKGEGVYGPVGRVLIRPTFGRVCCWVALATAILALVMAFRRGPRSPTSCLDGALCRSTSVPKAVAVALPVMILACLCFLLGSNYLLMAQTFVNLEQAPSFVWNAFQVMVYSLFYSINALYYEAHLPAMSWVLLCFSAILPYLKLIMMFICWLTPKRLLPVTLRSWILVIMDDIGKFSLVDVFTVQFLSGVFFIELVASSAEQPLKVVLRTNEELGFAAFVFATVASLIIGHFCRHFHERSVRLAACERGGDVELQEQVTSLEIPLSGVEAPRRKDWLDVLIGPLLLLTLGLCILGCFLPAFAVHLRTIFGALGSSEPSLFQFACDLPRFSEHPRSFAAVFNQVTFVLFAMGVNYLQLILLLLLWYGRVPRFRFMQRVNVPAVVHCLGAWAALDVTLISMIVTMLELRGSDFVHLEGKQRESLSRLSGIDVRGGDKGLAVDVRLGLGTYVLFVAVLLHAWVSRTALARRS